MQNISNTSIPILCTRPQRHLIKATKKNRVIRSTLFCYKHYKIRRCLDEDIYIFYFSAFTEVIGRTHKESEFPGKLKRKDGYFCL